MATYNKFNDFTEQQLIGTHDWDTNVFKVMLTSSAPSASNTVKADLTEITGSGYPGTNTTTITVTGDDPSAGYTTVKGTQVVFTASGGPIPTAGTFRYAVLYNDSAASKNLVAWWDYGSNITLNDGDTFTVKFNNASPGTIFTLV